MIINGENLILGRLASLVAKKALLGEKVIIVNSEKVVISGKKQAILKKYKERTAKGDPFKGPFFPRTPDRILRRSIRGMLPFKRSKGREAFKRVMCYINVPDKYKNEKLGTFKEINASRLKTGFMSLGELTGLLKNKPYSAGS